MIHLNLASLGQHIRSQRKLLGVSATMTAQSAGVSRVTLHRIEKGEPAVSMGAYCSVLDALGLNLSINLASQVNEDVSRDKATWIPAIVRLADYPQLQYIAWHMQASNVQAPNGANPVVLRPIDALSLYERNARHLDMASMSESEKNLLAALKLGLA